MSSEADNSNDRSGFVPGASVGAGRFTLIRQLGRGGMGVVWLARDERLREEVALKFLTPEVAHDASALEDMRRETLKSRKLSHPNIVRIHDLFESAEEPAFISMEFIEGKPLSAHKAQQPERLFTWEYLKPLVRQLCDALDYAHRSKLIHRDLKPANMMLDGEGNLKLADFGIAATAADSMSRVTRNVGLSGTPAYMSPQQIDGEPPRATDDLYALGATLYELLTSKPPFYTGDILSQVRNKEPKPLTERLADLELANDIPADVGALVLACLAKDPALRPQSARAVAEWIGLETSTAKRTSALLQPLSPSAEATTGVDATLASVDGQDEAAPAPPGGGNKLALWAGLAALLVASIFGAWWTQGRPATGITPAAKGATPNQSAKMQPVKTAAQVGQPAEKTQAAAAERDRQAALQAQKDAESELRKVQAKMKTLNGSVKAFQALADASQYTVKEFKVNIGGFERNQHANVTVLNDGTFLVAWHEGSPTRCLGQIYDTNGNAIGNRFPISPTNATGFHFGPAPAALPNGGFVVAWGAFAGLMQYFDNHGVPVGPILNPIAQDCWPALTVHTNGDLLVAGGQRDRPVYARRYNSAGVPYGEAFQAGRHVVGWYHVSLAYGSDGRFTIVWSSDGNIMARCYRSNEFSPFSEEFVVNSSSRGTRANPSARYQSDNTLIIAWSGRGDEDDPGIYLRRFGPSGEPFGKELMVNNSSTNRKEVANLAIGLRGELFVTWGEDSDVYGRLLSATGIPLCPSFRVNQYTTGNQRITDHAGLHGNAILHDDTLVVGWSQNGADGDGVYVTMIRPQLTFPILEKPVPNQGTNKTIAGTVVFTNLSFTSNTAAVERWTNSLGMIFVPVAGTEVLFSVWDTRVQDYEVFVTATGRSWGKPNFPQGPTHPAVNVSWEDAQAFCQWLTEKERKEGKLTASQSYRLPMDWEWSVAVGLNEPRAGTPRDKSMQIKNHYPWQPHNRWPLPKGAGNYEASFGVKSFDKTSPVGSFEANEFGLFDMGGNVWQWCEDFFDGKSGARVLRGAAWGCNNPGNLLSSYRDSYAPGHRDDGRGFRCVLAEDRAVK